jgi:hypothetical protein
MKETFFLSNGSFYLYTIIKNQTKIEMGLIDYFIEREEEPKGDQKNTPPVLTQTNTTVPPIPMEARPTSYQGTVSVSTDDLQKFNQHFDELFDKANLPGPDYFEFSKMCQAMSTLPEDMKFTAAFGGLQVQGLTKEKLLESANHYIAIIDEDANKFNSAIDQKILSDVQNKRSEAEQKRKSIMEREDMIKNLQQEIANETVGIAKLESEASEQEQKANQKSLTYKAACESRKAMIATDLQKINNLIK